MILFTPPQLPQSDFLPNLRYRHHAAQKKYRIRQRITLHYPEYDPVVVILLTVTSTCHGQTVYQI